MSFRLRIALTVFCVVIALAALQAGIVLVRIERADMSEQRATLRDELAEVSQLLGSPMLESWVDLETSHRTKWNELFFEVVDPGGQVVVRSANVPPAGIPDGSDSTVAGPLRYWTATHPTTRSGHRQIAGVERTINGYRVRVAKTLKRTQKRFWVVRERLAYGLLIISVLGGVAAWIVSTRVLTPIRALARAARALSVEGAATLPLPGTAPELDELSQVLNDFLGRARDEVARMRRLLDNTSHALRSPLTVLHGVLELRLARSQGEEADELANAVESTAYLTRLVNRLLRLAALESGRSTPLRIDMGEPVQSVIEYVKVLARDKGIDLKLEREEAPVLADPQQLREATANLLDNAIRHTPRGGAIRVRVRALPSTCVLEVEDTGPGLTPEELERVFERFYTAAGTPDGTGLGLPIARSIAHAHGGTLIAFSDHGARFVLELPRADGPAPASTSASTTASGHHGPS